MSSDNDNQDAKSQGPVRVDEKTLAELFGWSLCIPDYQRGYCWEKEHVESLLESLAYADVGDNENYHLGTVILHKHKQSQSCKECKLDEKQGGDVYDVVDGQQRLLTLSIIIHLFKKNNVQTPLLKCSTRDPDVIRHIYQNSRTVENWRDCHRTEWSLVNGTLDKLKFTVVTIAEEDGKSADSTLQLAWTFFNAINSGGKQLSDYDLLKAHHLRYLSKTNNDALIHYKAAKWDADGKEAKESFGIGNSKAQIYEALLAHTVYPIRSWLRNRRVQVYEQPADEKYCVLKHYSALLSFQCSEGSMTELSSGVIGGKEFFDWTEYWVWQYRRFCENPIIMRFNSVPWKSAQFHLRVIARAILFYYFCKFGDVYLADACVFILYRIGRLRNGTARRKDSWYGNREDERCVPHTIIALDESPTPEYFFKYCQLPSNRYVRYYDLKTSTKDDPLLNSWRHGPDWWKNLLGFVSSGQDKNPDGKAISIPLLENARIGNSVCYKKEIADLLNDVANDFGREFDKETLLLKSKATNSNTESREVTNG